MTTYFRVEAPASPRNDVTAGGTGKVFPDLEAAKAHKQGLIDSKEYREDDIRITTFSE